MEEYLKPLLMLGVSIAGSSIQGAVIKHKTGIDNDKIPVYNGATWGTAGIVAGNQADDPLIAIAGFAGATIASIGQKLVGKLFKLF